MRTSHYGDVLKGATDYGFYVHLLYHQCIYHNSIASWTESNQEGDADRSYLTFLHRTVIISLLDVDDGDCR